MQLPTGTVGGFGVRVYPAEGLPCMNHEVKNSLNCWSCKNVLKGANN